MGEIKHVLLTGANGFLGSQILKSLLENGYQPIITRRPTSDLWRITSLLDSCKIFSLAANHNNLDELFGTYQIDAIIHTATSYGRNNEIIPILETNVIFPISLLEKGLKNRTQLFINTDSFFAKPVFNQTYLKQYTNSKRILEQLLFDFEGNIKIANLRIEHVFGENDSEQKFFTTILKKQLENEPEIPLTAGQQKRDFIYVGDVANAFITVLKNSDRLDKYEEFQVGMGNSIQLKEFVQLLAKESQSKSNLGFGKLETRPGDIPDSFADIRKLTDLGWQPSLTREQAIKQTINKEKVRFAL